jgi:hypothetical protein
MRYSVADIADMLRSSPHRCDVIDRLIIILDLCHLNNMDLEDIVDTLKPQELRAILSHMRRFESMGALADEFAAACRLGR